MSERRLWPASLKAARWIVAVGCLALSGCMSLDDLRGEKFPEDKNTQLFEQMRTHDKNNDSFVFSNKARQINRSLGGE